MIIEIRYRGGAVMDKYRIDAGNKEWILTHHFNNPRVVSVKFIKEEGDKDES